MELHPADRQIGDYLLKEVFAQGPVSTTWLAEQVSVKRPVLVGVLNATDEEARAEFIADLRAKATVDHPLISAIYEAAIEGERCFFAHEFLGGQTLQQCRENHVLFPASQLALLLRRVAEANIYLETRQLATERLSLSAIHYVERVTRLDNLVLSGQRFPGQSQLDIQFLGTTLPPLVAAAHPGTTTFLQILRWMRGEEVQSPLTWQAIYHYCEEIEGKLGGPVAEETLTQRFSTKMRRYLLPIIGLFTLSLIAGGIFLAMKIHPLAPSPPAPVPLVADVVMPARVSETGQTIPAFKIAGHATTIGEYTEFLQALEILRKSEQERTFDHPGQPATKLNHLPKDWDTISAAVNVHGIWNNRNISVDSPVIGVDWWDAIAYAEWRQARLPTSAEWESAFDKKILDTVSEWVGPATAEVSLAVGILELPRRKPSDPPAKALGAPKILPAENRSLRRSDLGFRIVTNPE